VAGASSPKVIAGSDRRAAAGSASAPDPNLTVTPLDNGPPPLFNRHMHNQVVIKPSGADQLSAVFGALADPTRRAILERLVAGEATVGELGAPFRMSQPAISKHLKVLESAGLVSRRRQGTANLSRLEPEALRGADDWLERYRAAWEERFVRLDEVLDGLRQQP
jgi:DNA-binding transcriptional ArsR family regulator